MLSLLLTYYIAFGLLLTSIPAVLSQSYVKKEHFVGKDFLSAFNWDTFDDPTHGRVNFLDQNTALASNLSYVDDNTFVMRADYHQIVPSYSNRGRDSVRITSHDAWGDSVIILNLNHMPEGCATWPAFWTLSKKGPWPNGGEIDIIEGVNLNEANLMSLHTTSNCMMPSSQAQSGKTVSTNCDHSVDYNRGCGVAATTPNSYGAPFNSNGGGFVVLWRSSAGIQIWHYPRGSSNIPPEVLQDDCPGPITPGAPSWGQPDASFTFGSNCDFASHFDDHQIVFDLTFCGDWAGSAFPTCGCGSSSCQDFVDNNPDAFANAYWEVKSLRIFTPQ